MMGGNSYARLEMLCKSLRCSQWLACQSKDFRSYDLLMTANRWAIEPVVGEPATPVPCP